MSVVYPNRKVQKATTHPPATGTAWLKASATTAVDVRPERHAPVTRIESALIEEVRNEMTNTSMTAA
jgi:hypothetical protein